MIYTFIISAGKQHRFQTNTPKALVDINNQPLLTLNIQHSLKHSDKVIIVASKENSSDFVQFKSKHVDVIEIESGLGCGDAIWQAINIVNINKEDFAFIMWGDSMQFDDNVFSACKTSGDYFVLPAVKEKYPYVQIITNKNNEIIGSHFSKYNEHIDKDSYHDQSLFYANGGVLKHALDNLHQILWDDSEMKYNSIHGNEMTFLDIFNYSDCFNYYDYNLKDKKPKVIEFKNCNIYAFNTVEELEMIKNKLKEIC